jgi:hypothetical protein
MLTAASSRGGRVTPRGIARVSPCWHRTAAYISHNVDHCVTQSWRCIPRRSMCKTAGKPAQPAPQPTSQPARLPQPTDTRGQPWWHNRGPISWRGFLGASLVGGGLTFLFKYYEMTLKDERFRSAGKAGAFGHVFLKTPANRAAPGCRHQQGRT